jgi:hypothetical protein
MTIKQHIFDHNEIFIFFLGCSTCASSTTTFVAAPLDSAGAKSFLSFTMSCEFPESTHVAPLSLLAGGQLNSTVLL